MRPFGRTSESREGEKAKKLQNIRRRKCNELSDTPAAKVRHDLSVKESSHHIAAEDHLALTATAYHMGKTPPYTPLTGFAPCLLLHASTQVKQSLIAGFGLAAKSENRSKTRAYF
jgi:hypothetical protein